jgi:hypothetical protein
MGHAYLTGFAAYHASTTSGQIHQIMDDIAKVRDR